MSALLSQLRTVLASWDAVSFSHSDDTDYEGEDEERDANGVEFPSDSGAVRSERAGEATAARGGSSSLEAFSLSPLPLAKREGAEAAAVLSTSPPPSSSNGCVAESAIPVNMFTNEFTWNRNDNKDNGSQDGVAPPAKPRGRRRRFSRSTRAALSRVELARAALALFTSNAGNYRPILQKVLSFVFAYLDYLVEERSSRLFAAATAGGAGSGATSSSGGGGEENDDDNSDVVATAYQKVRLVEARMAALAEEASAQRDRFKAQIAIQQQQQQKLEGLLRHQMEMNHVLVNRPLSLREEEEQALGIEDTAKAAHMTGAELEKYAARRQERDARYVQRLIARAEKEKVIEELETQVGELATERLRLNERVLSLEKLNSRYARQAVELAARLSIMNDHNIGLAADAQLYQRDAVKDRQRSEKMERELDVARNTLLTLLEVRRREMAFGGGALYGTGAAPREALLLAAVAAPQDGAAPAASGEGAPRDSNPLTASPSANDNGGLESGAVASASSSATSNTALSATSIENLQEGIETAVLNVRDTILRRKLQEILAINDTALGGATKSALLSVLSLNSFGYGSGASLTVKRGGGNEGSAQPAVAAASAGRVPMPGDPKEYLWAPPYGHNRSVPRHLRATGCVRLLPFHPLVAESFIHELLSQRQDLIDYLSQEAEAMALLYIAPSTRNAGSRGTQGPAAGYKGQEPAAAGGARESVFSPLPAGPSPTLRMLPLDEFVELFINIVWLCRSARFLPLLPDAVQLQIASEAAAAAQGGDEISVQRGMWQQQIHSLIHSGRKAPEELLQLPEEGLRLTYSLDTASRRADAGFLTYAYGLASRQVISEVIFDVMRCERTVFLAMCEAVDRQRAEAKAAIRKARTRELLAQSQAAEKEVGNAVQPVTATRTPATADARRKKGAKSANHAKRAAAADKKAAENAAAAAAAGAGAKEEETVQLQGCIPTVQLARVLATMFPSYSVALLEELVLAAVEDGTDGTQSPVLVYYTVLLPQRLLPGSAAAAAGGPTTTTTETDAQKRPNASTSVDGGKGEAAAAAGASGAAQVLARSAVPASSASATAAAFWEEGRFATLFYKSICDDALEAAQVVQDSVWDYGRNRAAAHAAKEQSSPPGPSPLRAAAAASNGRGNGKQGTESEGSGGDGDKGNLTLGDVPTSATIKQLCAFALQGVPPAEERRWGGAIRVALQRWPQLLQDERRAQGLDGGVGGGGGAGGEEAAHLNALLGSSDLSPAAAGAAASATHVAIADVVPFLRRHVLLRRGLYPRAQTRQSIEAALRRQRSAKTAATTTAAKEGGQEHCGTDGSSWWSQPQQTYIVSLQARWEQFATADEAPLPDEADYFCNCLWQFDPARAQPWSTNLIGEGSPNILRCPLSELDADTSATGPARKSKRSAGRKGMGQRPHSPLSTSSLPTGEARDGDRRGSLSRSLCTPVNHQDSDDGSNGTAAAHSPSSRSPR